MDWQSEHDPADTSHPSPQPSPLRGEGVKRSFWQNKYVQDLVPFLTSITLHITLITVAAISYAGYKALHVVEQEQVIVPDRVLVDGPVGGVPNPGLGEDPNRKAAQDQVADAPSESAGWSSRQRQSLTNTLMGGGSGESAEEALIAAGPGGIGKGKSSGSGTGENNGGGTGDGVGQLAIFGVPGGGGGIGPMSKVFGRTGNAMRISYVCDASGSMMDKIDLLKIELRKAVDALQPIQVFDVIFFQEKDVASAEQRALVVANPDNKRKAYKFLEQVAAHGSTDPIPALKLAFDQKPQLIYLLTDGDFPDNQAVLDYIRQRNAEHKVKINTIAFVGRGEEYEKIMKQIAKDSGGIFKYVSGEELK
jgi:hypothetical protein